MYPRPWYHPYGQFAVTCVTPAHRISSVYTKAPDSCAMFPINRANSPRPPGRTEVKPRINELYMFGWFTPHLAKAELNVFWEIKEEMVPGPVGTGPLGGVEEAGGEVPAHAAKFAKQDWPEGQLPLFAQAIPHDCVALVQSVPQRVVDVVFGAETGDAPLVHEPL